MREALVHLLWAWIALAIVPFRHLAAWMGESGAESHRDSHPELEQTVEAVSWALRAVALRVPWDCRCLAQALAGHRMLRKYGLRSTVYFGVSNDTDAPFDAHAWLRCGSWLVTGGEGHQKYRILGQFPPRDTAMNEGDRPVASLPLLPPIGRSRVLPLASSPRREPSPRAPHVMSGQSPTTPSA